MAIYKSTNLIVIALELSFRTYY